MIDEEIGRFPDHYRLPMPCGLRGLSAAAAATELGWLVGSVASRVRAELARRLATRGIAVGVLATARRVVGEGHERGGGAAGHPPVGQT